MTTLIRIAIALVLSLFLSSCAFDFSTGEKGNGNIVEESREITSEFTQISASEGIRVFVTQANNFDIAIEADENIIDLIGTDINNGKLRIHAIRNIGNATKKVYVSMPKINAISSSSGAHLSSKNVITTSQLDLNASSGSILTAEIETEDLEIDASSGANINLSGKASNADIDGSSGANIRAKDLLSERCNAQASSGANLNVNVSKNLTADASSGGNISYSGDAEVHKKKSVSGSVHKY